MYARRPGSSHLTVLIPMPWQTMRHATFNTRGLVASATLHSDSPGVRVVLGDPFQSSEIIGQYRYHHRQNQGHLSTGVGW